jgi:hypothetical protein
VAVECLEDAVSTTSVADCDLDERIAAAFGDGAKSADVSKVVKEAGAAAVWWGDAADKARNRALDAALPPAAVAAARREMEDAAFRAERLNNAVHRLADRVRQLERREAEQERARHAERLTAERDALAKELEEVYPQFATRLADLLARIEACDREAQHRGVKITSAEYVARGLSGPVQNGREVPSLVRTVRLPAWEPSEHEPFA